MGSTGAEEGVEYKGDCRALNYEEPMLMVLYNENCKFSEKESTIDLTAPTKVNSDVLQESSRQQQQSSTSSGKDPNFSLIIEFYDVCLFRDHEEIKCRADFDSNTDFERCL